MPRIHHVAHAQQRFVMVPITDPATGQPKIITTSRVSRRTGRPVTQRATRPDQDQPLAPESCERCHAVIQPKSAAHPGDPYKYTDVKTGPYTSKHRVRCAACPSWQPWELSNSLSARIMEIEHRFRETIEGAESTEGVESALSDTAGEVEALADEKDEAAENIESGFQHETGQSAELHEQAEQLREWADEIQNAEVPELPEAETEGADPDGDQMTEWRSECADLLGDCPV